MGSKQKFSYDLSNRVMVVTGSTSGIGQQVAQNLAGMGAEVILACRNEDKGRATQEQITAETGNDKIHIGLVDFSIQASIREFAEWLLGRFPAIHVLVNNAGLWTAKRELTVDGIEKIFATNVLGYYLLTDLLLDRLQASAPARIVNVASELARGLDLDDLQYERRPFSGMDVYAQSKQANRMLTWALAERLEGTGVTANALHPGFIQTDLARDQKGLFGYISRLAFRYVARGTDQGAIAPTYLASAPELEGVHGKFWIGRKEKPCRFRNLDHCRSLEEACRQLVLSSSASV